MNQLKLIEWATGEFDNTAQSKEEPTWYVPLRLWHRLLPHRIQGKWAIFAEQANFLDLERPYRQRVWVLEPQPNGGLAVQYWAFKDPARFRGAGANPGLLEDALEPALDLLPGCWLDVQVVGDVFEATPREGDRCCFTYDSKLRQVVLGFEASETQFLSYDRGVDPETGQSLWGALMGPYRHQKRLAYPVITPAE
ncbi:CpcT/CpeT family chromophore lyase [Altericista sp. CCNU0014]|uniref:CpcT/CpeT family chromophore lyase n=1 Tax=Altericista sp. CCNU0014 TaxID=3082949 RepID=UPI00384C6E39